MTPLDKAIDRINKLLALSKDGGATEAEAALAAEMAQRIMEEHNLSMATVEARGGSSGEDGKRDKTDFVNTSPYKWKRHLMVEVGKLNFCHVQGIWHERGVEGGSRTKTFRGFRVIGRAANVAATSVMFDYLVHSINRLALEEVGGDGKELFTRYTASFREGCCDRIIERLREKREQALAEQERKAREQNATARHPSAAPGTGLVVVMRDYAQDEDDLNTDFRRGLAPGTTAQRRREQLADYAKRQRLYDAAIADGHSPEIAYYLSHGYSLERAQELAQPAKPEKPETEKQRQKRHEREQRERQRWQDREDRQFAKRDWSGYNRGTTAGDTVGLDPQVGRKGSNRSLR